ncbi:MAG: hypothetical protein R3B45_10275 [Bdellovibrionota bacterium]
MQFKKLSSHLEDVEKVSVRSKSKNSILNKSKSLDEGYGFAKVVDTPKRIFSYEEFLPSSLPEFKVSTEPMNKTAELRPRSFDPEGDGFGVDMKLQNLPKMSVFARKIISRLSIPRSFINLVARGEAFLRINKDKNGWNIKKLTGNKYLRASIYEAMGEMQKSIDIANLMEKIQYTSLRIYFSYRTVNVLDETIPALDIKIDGNKIFLSVAHKVTSRMWAVAMPVENDRGNDLILPNIIGIGALLLDSIRADKEIFDRDILHLKNSPAYDHSIED